MMRYLLSALCFLAFACTAFSAEPVYYLSNGTVTVGAGYDPPAAVVIQVPATPVRTAVTRMVQECTFDAFGRKTGCRMVPKIEYVDVPQRTNWTENNLTLPGAVWGPSVTTSPGVGMHSHRRTDGTIFTHSDSNQGNAAAHAGVAWPWNKVAVSAVPATLATTTYSTSYTDGYAVSARPVFGTPVRSFLAAQPIRTFFRNLFGR